MVHFVRHLPIFLLAALAGACAGAGTSRPRPPRAIPLAADLKPASAPSWAKGSTLAAMTAAPPDLTWEASRLAPATDYLHFPSAEGGSGFFLVRDGFRYLDVDDFALRYDRVGSGFSLVEVKKRFGTSNLAQCPVYFPIENCVESHYLLFATVVSCGVSCSYRFIVFDSHSAFPITLKDPAIFGVLKRLVDPWLPPPEIEVKFEESGSIRELEAEWADYVRDRFAFIAARVREARKPPGFSMISPALQ